MKKGSKEPMNNEQFADLIHEIDAVGSWIMAIFFVILISSIGSCYKLDQIKTALESSQVQQQTEAEGVQE